MSDLYDARSAAWVTAWDNLEAAIKLHNCPPRFYEEDYLRNQIDLHLRTADICSRLAVAPSEIGIGAGAVITERAEREQSRSNRINDLLRKLNDEAEVEEKS